MGIYIAVTSIIKLLEFINCMQPHAPGWNESAYYSTDCLQKVHLWRDIDPNLEAISHYLTQEDQVMMCAFDWKKSLISLSSVYIKLFCCWDCWQRVKAG